MRWAKGLVELSKRVGGQGSLFIERQSSYEDSAMMQAVADGNLSHAIPAKFTDSRASQSISNRATRLLDKIIFSSLLVLIVLAATPYSTVEPWSDSILECGVFALGVLWVVETLISKKWLTRNHRLLVPLLALTVFAFAQTLPFWDARAVEIEGTVWRAVSADPYETRLVAFKIFALTLTLGLLLQYTSSPRRLRLLIQVVLGVAVASALFGIAREASQVGTYLLPPSLAPGLGYGQFINRNHFAFLMEMALGLALGLAVGGSIDRRRLLVYFVTGLGVWSALVLTNSRGGIFSMLSQLLFLPLLWNATRKSPKGSGERSDGNNWTSRTKNIVLHTSLITGLVTAIFVGVLWVGGDPLVNQIDSIPKDFSTESSNERRNTNRTYVWEATWKLIKANPVAGVGFGGYWIAIPQYHDASGRFSPQEAHNDYLELLASGGLIGAALGVWFVIVLVQRSVSRLRSSDPFRRAACLGALVGLFGVGVHSVVDFGLHLTVNALVFTTLVVIATADDQVFENKEWNSEVSRHRLSIA